jgi:hypothetical protein
MRDPDYLDPNLPINASHNKCKHSCQLENILCDIFHDKMTK